MMRSTFHLAAAGVLLAAVALALALAAIIRAGDGGVATGQMPMGQADGHSMGPSMEHDAAAPQDGVPQATTGRGGQPLGHETVGDTWVFRLTTKPVKWEILPGVLVTAWAYNGTVPGPEIRVPYGQRLRVEVENELPDPTTVHWHGLAVPNAMDGVPGITQKPVEPGETFTYEFRAIPAGRDSKGGTFFYHSHFDEDRQVGLGLSGALVIEPRVPDRYDVERTVLIGEWNLDSTSGATRPPMQMEGMLPNFFTLNGKSFPATETITVERGDRVLLRVIGAGQFTHPMHLHGTDFRLVAKDGHPATKPIAADVVDVASGERYDLAFRATEPGRWVFHCHIGHHLTNDGESPGGLILVVDVT